jgi:hypothetical protein
MTKWGRFFRGAAPGASGSLIAMEPFQVGDFVFGRFSGHKWGYGIISGEQFHRAITGDWKRGPIKDGRYNAGGSGDEPIEFISIKVIVGFGASGGYVEKDLKPAPPVLLRYAWVFLDGETVVEVVERGFVPGFFPSG